MSERQKYIHRHHHYHHHHHHLPNLNAKTVLFDSFFNLPSHLFPSFAALLLLLPSLSCLLSQVSPFFLSLSHNHKSALIFQNIFIYSYIHGKGVQNLILFYKIIDTSLVYEIPCFSLSQQQQKNIEELG